MTNVLNDRFPDLWAVLADKGYQGIQESLPVILPMKNKRNKIRLSLDERKFNKDVAADRLLGENLFGRM